MDVFALRDRLVEDYASYTRSFIKIANPRIRCKVDAELDAGAFWPEPLLQLNPAFKPGGTIDDLVAEGILHEECARIFRLDKTDADPAGKQLPLYAHQAEAIRKAKARKSYVLTSGTGSGKSLTYIVPIVDHVLRRRSGKGIQAIIVYPGQLVRQSPRPLQGPAGVAEKLAQLTSADRESCMTVLRWYLLKGSGPTRKAVSRYSRFACTSSSRAATRSIGDYPGRGRGGVRGPVARDSGTTRAPSCCPQPQLSRVQVSVLPTQRPRIRPAGSWRVSGTEWRSLSRASLCPRPRAAAQHMPYPAKPP